MCTMPAPGHIMKDNTKAVADIFIPQRADPYVCRYGESYYFTASVPEYDRIVIRRAGTLKGLRDAQEVCAWRKHDEGDMSFHVWAPELHLIDGRYYIYFASSRKDDIWALRPWVLACKGSDPLADEWEELGMMQPADNDIYSFRAFSLDATILENRGEMYFLWAEKVSVGIQISNIYIARMESPTKLATPQVLLITPDYEWERVNIWVNEGPAAIHHDGRIFLTYSASATGKEYCMGMLSIGEDEDLLDPRAWRKEKEPVLAADEKMGFFGPGHNSFVSTPEGDVCVFHARNYADITGDPLYDPNRHAYVMRLLWRDGKPVFNYENCFV